VAQILVVVDLRPRKITHLHRLCHELPPTDHLGVDVLIVELVLPGGDPRLQGSKQWGDGL